MKIPYQDFIHEFMLDYRNFIFSEVWAAVEQDAKDHGDTPAHKRLVFKILAMRPG